MAGPQIDIVIPTGSAESNLRRLTGEFNRLGQTAAQLSRTKFRLIDPGELGTLEEMQRRMQQVLAMHPSLRTALRASGQDPRNALSANWQQVPLTQSQIRTLMHGLLGQSGGSVNERFERAREATSIGDAVSRSLGRFFGGMGGGAGQVGAGAAGGMAGGGGLGGLLKGGGIAAGAFAAYKAGQMVMQGLDMAKTQAVAADQLKRQMGDLGISFKDLTNKASLASNGLEVNSVEALKLMTEFNRLSGGVKDSTDLMAGTRVGIGAAKALGLDPERGVNFFGGMRHLMGGGSERGDRRLALMIGDTIVKSGMSARSEEVLQAIHGYAEAASRLSLTAPNVAGFAGAYSGLVGARVPGLTGGVAASMLGQADAAVANMGAFGEASQTFTLAAFNRGGTLNPIQAKILAEGGLFGTRGQQFGRGSIYRRYMESEGAGSGLDGLLGSDAGKTNFQAIREQLDAMNVAPELKAEMAKNYFGMSSISQAMALMTLKPHELGATESLLGRNGIDLKNVNESGIVTLSKIANAGGMGDLSAIASDLMGRSGKGALSEDEKRRLAAAQHEAAAGGEGGFKLLQDTLVKLSADKDKQETMGSQIVDQEKRVENAMIDVGKSLLGPLVIAKDALLSLAKMGPEGVRQAAAGYEKSDIDAAFQKQIDAVGKGDDQGGLGGEDWWASLNPFGPGRTKEQNDAWAAEMARRKQKIADLVRMREGKKAEVDRRYQSNEDFGGLAGGGNYALTDKDRAALGTVQLTDEQERILADVAGGDPSKLSYLRNVLTIENRGKRAVDNGATSGKGARGAFQFMKPTADALAKKLGMKSYDLSDFRTGARLAGEMHDQLSARWGGDRAKMYAGYNGSPELAAKGGLSGNFENDQYVAMGRYLDATPLPAGDPGARADRSAQPVQVAVNGEFNLYDVDRRQAAPPVQVSGSAPLPRAQGGR